MFGVFFSLTMPSITENGVNSPLGAPHGYGALSAVQGCAVRQPTPVSRSAVEPEGPSHWVSFLFEPYLWTSKEKGHVAFCQENIIELGK